MRRRNEEFRFGSARFAWHGELRKAGLFDGQGAHLGFSGGRSINLESDSPILRVGGAGSGKMRDSIAYDLCRSPGVPMMVLDPRGEGGAISFHMHARHGEFAWFWNPSGLSWLPQHRCNPLDILKPHSPTLQSDNQFIMRGTVPASGSESGKYFEMRAQDWLGGLSLHRVEEHGSVSFPDLYRLSNIVESDPQAWGRVLERMLASRFENVRRVAGEMLAKQQDSPKEFGSIMGEIYAHLGFLAEPSLRASLEASDDRSPRFSLDALCNEERVSKIFLNVPAEFLQLWAPILRVFFTVAMLYKGRKPGVRRVSLVIDEAAQTGRFEALLQAFTYGRGMGIRATAVFQDLGQIVRNFGAPALQSFIGSAQTRQFFGVRDFETAQVITQMLGNETLQYTDAIRQSQARKDKRRAAFGMMSGDDPFGAAFDYVHADRVEHERANQSRPLMAPDEILNMREDQQVLFVAGKNLHPIFAQKHPYFERHEMAGCYLPNPYHPPTDRVRIKTRFGHEWRRIISHPVPEQWSIYPQYQDRDVLWVEGTPFPYADERTSYGRGPRS